MKGTMTQDDLPRRVLAQLGALPGASGPLERRVVVALSLAVSTVAFAFSVLTTGEDAKRYAQILGVLGGALAFIFAYLQWRAGRHEASYDKYYDRLEIANRRFDAARLQALKGNEGELSSHTYTMFVFAELDNFEYLLGKYRLRYIRADLARRAVRGFADRCREPAFCAAAAYWVEQAGYEDHTRRAVAAVVAGMA